MFEPTQGFHIEKTISLRAYQVEAFTDFFIRKCERQREERDRKKEKEKKINTNN
jgi:hypothetical protein